jgi:hypothetical protein
MLQLEIHGDLYPEVVIVPPVALTVPPPRSVALAAELAPLVEMPLNGCDQSSPTGSRGSEADGCFKLTHFAGCAELGFLGTVLDLALRPER